MDALRLRRVVLAFLQGVTSCSSFLASSSRFVINWTSFSATSEPQCDGPDWTGLSEFFSTVYGRAAWTLSLWSSQRPCSDGIAKALAVLDLEI